MSDVRGDGGPAFPTEDFRPFASGGGRHVRLGGMSLRDYFAAQALPFCLSEFGGNDQRQYAAEAAYQIADAMLTARDK